MKKVFSFTLIALICLRAISQNIAINTSGLSADNSAMLDVSSSTKGLLMPRMTSALRTAIVSPANGLMVFDTDTKTFWYFSTTWNEINLSSGGFSLPYAGSSSSNFSAFSITNNNVNLGSTGIYAKGGGLGSGFIVPYTMGIWGDNSIGVGVAGSSNTIGVLGITNGNDANGIGVKGVNGSDNYGAVTGENSKAGGGVRGIFAGPSNSFGYGVIGETGKNGNNGVAGRFINNNSNGLSNSLEALNYGKGNGLLITLNNSLNNAAGILVDHSGTGDLLRLWGQNNSQCLVTNNGNLLTTGTVSVRGDKGIIRNSTPFQLRYEKVQAAVEGLNGASILIPAGDFIDRTFGYSAPFGSIPAVSLGNLLPGAMNADWKIDAKIISASTTGFTIRLINYSSQDFFVKGTWNVMVMGAE